MVGYKWCYEINRINNTLFSFFLVFILICISADFDPVHKGHEKLIKEAIELGNNESKKVVVYLNKGFSANHAPFFLDFNARKEMALALGVDEVKSFEGLHHRLILSYSVPIRLQQMIDDGGTDYITSASISLDEISGKAKKFIEDGNFLGMPKNYTNRNEIRWFALNKFLDSGLKFHIVKELNKDKYSGRLIRQSIIENEYNLNKEIKTLLPKSSVEIIEEEISKNNIDFSRDWNSIYKTLNTYSRGNLTKIAYLNGECINQIIKKRVYSNPESVWAAFRRANYGPVMTRLAISAIEMNVSKKEVMDLMKYYESKNVIPEMQKIKQVINRAWYVASNIDKISAREANDKFKKGNIIINDSPLSINAGLNLTRFETKIMQENIDADLYVDKNNKISVQLKTKGKKIKTNLKLPAREVTYLRYIMDSQFIPVHGTSRKTKKGYEINIKIA